MGLASQKFFNAADGCWYEIKPTRLENDRWITVHPNKENPDDYRRLKVEDGETAEQAVERKYGDRQEELFDKKTDLGKTDYKKDTKTSEEREEERTQQEKDKADDKKRTDAYKKALKEKDAEDANLSWSEFQSKHPDVSYEDYMSHHNYEKEKKAKEKQAQEKKQENHPFGDDVEVKHTSGFFASTKGRDIYKNKNGQVEVETFGSDGEEKYMVNPVGGSVRYFSTKSGMEKYVNKFLNPKAEEAKEVKDLESARAKYQETKKKYEEADSKKWHSEGAEWARAVIDSEKYKKELTKDRRDYAESIMGNFESQGRSAYEEKQDARRERFEELSDRYAKQSANINKAVSDHLGVIPFGQPIIGQRDRNYRDKWFNKIGQAVEADKKADYYADRAESVGKAGISADDANAIQKLAEKYKHTVDSAERRRIIDRVISIHETGLKNKEIQAKQESGNYTNPYADLGFSVDRNTDINRLQLKFDGKPDEATRSILKSNGFRWSPREGAWQRQLGSSADSALNWVAQKLRDK